MCMLYVRAIYVGWHKNNGILFLSKIIIKSL